MTLARTPYARLSPADIGQVDRELKKLEQMSQGLYVPKVLVAARSPYPVQGTDTMLLCDCTAGPITLTFPLAARVDGMCVQVVKSDTSTNAVTLSGTFSGVVNPTITVAHAGFTIVAMNGAYHITAFIPYPILPSENGVLAAVYPYGDIRRYGAVGSNAAVDGLAIRNAIISIKALGRGEVLIPVGNWYMAEVAAQGIVLPDGVRIRGASRLYSIIHATGTWTDSVVRAETRDDNNPNNYVTPGLSSLMFQMDTTSAVTCLDLCGVRNGRFVDLHLNGSGTGNGQVGIRLADRNITGTSNKSCFFNHLEAIDGAGAGWGTWFQAAQFAGNCSTNTFIQGNTFCRIAFDFTQFSGLASAHNVFIRHYNAGDANAASETHKSGIVGSGAWISCDFEGFVSDSSVTYGLGPMGIVTSSQSETAYIGGLKIPALGPFTLGGFSPLMSEDVLAPCIITGLAPAANTSTTLRISSGGVPCAAYNVTWLSDPNDIILTHTNTGLVHTEYVVLNNLTANGITSRVVIQLTAPTVTQVPIAQCTVDATGNRTALTDTRLLGAAYKSVRGLSATATAAKNLRGSTTISGASLTAVVAFPNTETDLNFFVQVTVSATSGTPPAGSTRAYATLKTSTGFTLNLEVAPGVGNSVTADWLIVR